MLPCKISRLWSGLSQKQFRRTHTKKKDRDKQSLKKENNKQTDRFHIAHTSGKELTKRTYTYIFKQEQSVAGNSARKQKLSDWSAAEWCGGKAFVFLFFFLWGQTKTYKTLNTTNNSLLDRFSRETAAKIDIKRSNFAQANFSEDVKQNRQCNPCSRLCAILLHPPFFVHLTHLRLTGNHANSLTVYFCYFSCLKCEFSDLPRPDWRLRWRRRCRWARRSRPRRAAVRVPSPVLCGWRRTWWPPRFGALSRPGAPSARRLRAVASPSRLPSLKNV